MSAEGKASLVFIPFPIVSHLVSAIKTAEFLAAGDGRLSITFLIMDMSTDTKIGSYINTPHPRINFAEIERDESNGAESAISAKNLMQFVGSHKASARNFMSEMKRSRRVAGVLIDVLCVPMIDVAKELEISSYIFYPSGAAILGFMLDLQILHDQDLAEYQDSDASVSISSYASPVPVRVLPGNVFDGENGFVEISRKLREVDGIIVNTFLEFEPYAIGSISGDERFPRVYPIGPMIGEVRGESDEIMRWLDGQPDSSVVFICFGSMGAFPAEQVAEIAVGLERSGKRFLWSLRKPAVSDRGFAFPEEYEDPGEVLPEGFLERTAGVGRVIGWAPQMAVLSHPSVGGFVSHCGWNSTLESVCCGVPMAAWPLGAEQQMNAFQLVKEIGIAVEIKMDYRKNSNEMVGAEIIERGIKQLMEPTKEIGIRVKELKEKSKTAVVEGGSSYKFLGHFIRDLFTY